MINIKTKYLIISLIWLYIYILTKSRYYIQINLQQYIGSGGGAEEGEKQRRIEEHAKLSNNKAFLLHHAHHGLFINSMNPLKNTKHCIDNERNQISNSFKEKRLYNNSEEMNAYVNVQCKDTHNHKACAPIGLLGNLTVNMGETNLKDLQSMQSLRFVKKGGWWLSNDCRLNKNLAIIIPYKNRETQLAIFLRHYHPIFQRQKLHYRIFVVEQVDEFPFNRGKLMNIGFREALKFFPYNCFVFHDVDLLLEDDRLLYNCQSSPQHMCVALDKFDYKLRYEELFGGIEMFSREHYIKVNGFSNVFWGWGAEDDNLYRRLRWKGITLWRPSTYIARYKMVKHKDLEGNADPFRFQIRKESYKHFATDGLTNLQYEVKDILEENYFTRIQVDLRKYKDTMFGQPWPKNA